MSSGKRAYLDNNERFGFMVRGKEATCKVLSCTIRRDDARVFDNVDKSGPVCMTCAQQIIKGNPLEDIASELDRCAARIKRIEAFLSTNGSWREHVKTYQPD